MMQLNLTPPPGLRGDEKSQLVQMHSFLFRLTEQLNAALIATDERITAAEKVTGLKAVETGDKPPLTEQYTSLKSLIVKTAHTVRTEMDVIEASLRKDYIAKSEWGTYEENLKADFESTAEGVIEDYGFVASIENLDRLAAGFDSYIVEASGYIKRGIIGYNDDSSPIFGIAIGQDLKSTTVTVDGVEYEEIDTTRNLATYTATGITFWQNGQEVAWFTNSELVCNNISVNSRVRLGGKWEISHTNGFTVKWIGGE